MEPNHRSNSTNGITDNEREEALIKYRIIQPFLQKVKTLAAICEGHKSPRRTIS